jgi:FtsH-binding integral membrane protein
LPIIYIVVMHAYVQKLAASSLGAALIMTAITYRSAYDPIKKQLTCDRKILNTYLHLATMMLVMVGVAALSAKPMDWVYSTLSIWAIFALNVALLIASIVLLVILTRTDPKEIRKKYSLLAAWLLVSGILFAHVFIVFPPDVLSIALAATLGFLLLLTLFAFAFPHLLLKAHNRVLNTIIIGALLVSIVLLFVVPRNSLAFIGIFCVLGVLMVASLAYDTKDIMDMPCSETHPPAYVDQSVTMLVNLRLLFQSILNILSGRRSGRGSRR